MTEYEKLLDEQIETEIGRLSDLEIGSEEYKVTVDGLAKLMDKSIEIKKLESEEQENWAKRQLETKKLEQSIPDKKDQWVKNGIAIAGIVIPSVITVWGTLKSFEFEKEGTVTTIMGRGFINKLLPKK